MKKINFIFLILLLFQGCGRNVQKNLENIIADYQQQGKRIVMTSKEKHFVIYQNENALWINNLDEPERILLSSDSIMTKITFTMGFSKNGMPSIEQSYDQIKLEKYVFQDHMTSNFRLLDDNTIAFTHQYSEPNPWDPDGEDEIVWKDEYVYYLSKPDTVFFSRISPKIDILQNTRQDKVGLYVNYLAQAIDGSFSYGSVDGGIFEWNFDINEYGQIVQTNEIEYHNEETDVSMNFYLSDFSSKIQAQNVLTKIEKALDISFRKKIEEERKEQINSLIEESLTLEELSEIFANPIKAKKEYIGKTITISCKLEAIKEANGFFDKNGYKYKICCFALEAFGEWIDGYDLVGYTNDENFVDLSYPKKVVVKAILTSGTRRKFEFKDCELLAW